MRKLTARIFHIIRKNLYWYFSKKKFAKNTTEKLSNIIFSHKTILRRPLKDIDMELQENKIKNLKIAIKHLNKITIKPKETFSYWRQIGNPTTRKGYIDGMILKNGKVTRGTGGGLCQLSNLIFWMTLHTPLQVTERWRHSYDVFPDIKRSQPFGSGATCSYPNIDLEIYNPTNQNFQLSLEVTPTHLVGQWLSNKPTKFEYKIVERDHEIKHELIGTYTRNNKLFRITKKSGKKISEELVVENKAIMMYEPLIEN